MASSGATFVRLEQVVRLSERITNAMHCVPRASGQTRL
jgi:hypothetical protein